MSLLSTLHSPLSKTTEWEEESMRITVVGSGGWGTALALLLLENGNDVTLWSYHQAESDAMREKRESPCSMVSPSGRKSCTAREIPGARLVMSSCR